MTYSAWRAASIWLLVVLASLWVIRHTTINGDISAFLPSKPSEAQQILVDQLQDGVVSRILLLAIEGGGEDQRVAASKAFLEQLDEMPSLAYVQNGDETRLGPERDFLLNNRYVLSEAVTPQRFTPDGLRESLENNLDLLGSPLSMLVKRILPQDPSGEFIHLIEQFEGESRPAQRDGVWFSRDGKRALLVAQTKAPGFDLDAQELIVKDMRERFAKISGGTDLKLLAIGPGIFAINTRAAIGADATKYSTIATVLVAALLLFFYRSPRILLLGLLPVGTGALVGISAVSLIYGGVHGITLGFGVTLIGEAVDYAIYLFTQQSRNQPVRESLSRIWPTLRLGVMTSVAGFSAMFFSGFPGLGQLGLFSIAGIVTALLVTRWVLPHFLPKGFSAHIGPALQRALLGIARNAPKLKYLLWLLVVAALAVLFWHRNALWNDDLGSLSPMPIADKKLDESLRNDIGAPEVGVLLAVKGETEEDALRGSEKLTHSLRPLIAQGVMTGFDAPSLYLPSKASQEARRSSIPETSVLRANMDAALQGMPFNNGLFQPFLDEIAKAKSAPALTRESLAGTAFQLKLEGLLVTKRGSTVALLPIRGLKDIIRLQQAITKLNAPNVTLINFKTESDQLFSRYRHQSLINLLLGAAAIALLLLVSLRSVARTYRVLAPLAAAVIVTIAITLLAGHGLSIFHIVALLLVIGVGSNYSLFFDSENFARAAPERTLASLVLCNISTIIGFGLLGLCQTPVLAAIGGTVAIGAFLSLVFAAIITPRQTSNT